jgi:hypothetical protein
MKLYLVEIGPSTVKEYGGWNDEKYSDPIAYFWEYAVSGCGVDVFRWGTIVTVFTIVPDDVKLFPELTDVAQVGVWEEDGVVRSVYRNKTKDCLVCQDPLELHTWHLGTIICPDGYELETG